jgi:hypothetical protein
MGCSDPKLDYVQDLMPKGGMKMIRNRSEISKGSFQSAREREGLSKRTFLKGLAFACLGVGPFLNTCGIMNNGNANQEPVRKPDGPSRNVPVPKATRPPIDLAAPAKIETATFALG